MEKVLKHKTTAYCSGLAPSVSGGHRSGGKQAHYALTLNLDHLDVADQRNIAKASSLLNLAELALLKSQYWRHSLPYTNHVAMQAMEI